MTDITVRIVDAFAEPETSALQGEVFADYEPSALLAEVIAAESAARSGHPAAPLPSAFRAVALRGDVLVGWTQGHREGKSQFCMLNSGVAAHERRQGVYSRLVEAVLGHATAQGYATVTSRHVAANVAVIIAKLHLGFQISGFEYSEVYGPLVRLTYLVGEERRRLYRARAIPLRAPR